MYKNNGHTSTGLALSASTGAPEAIETATQKIGEDFGKAAIATGNNRVFVEDPSIKNFAKGMLGLLPDNDP
ncbi:hypothetical protein BGZ82_003735, partial [Podila clonocystis]